MELGRGSLTSPAKVLTQIRPFDFLYTSKTFQRDSKLGWSFFQGEEYERAAAKGSIRVFEYRASTERDKVTGRQMRRSNLRSSIANEKWEKWEDAAKRMLSSEYRKKLLCCDSNEKRQRGRQERHHKWSKALIYICCSDWSRQRSGSIWKLNWNDLVKDATFWATKPWIQGAQTEPYTARASKRAGG